MDVEETLRNYCRTCLASDCEMISLIKSGLLSILKKCFSVKVNDNESKYICKECNNFLEQYLAFKQRCLDVEKVVRGGKSSIENYLQNNTNKGWVTDEKDDDIKINKDSSHQVKLEEIEKEEKKKDGEELDSNINDSFTEEFNHSLTWDNSEADCKLKLEDDKDIEKEVKKEKKKAVANERVECYHCEYCQERFSYKNELRDHLSIHVEKKTYQCHICFKNYEGLGSLTRHYNSWHVDHEPTIKCADCQERFYCVEQLNLHLNEIHAKPKCPDCFQIFDKLKMLHLHMRKQHSKLYLSAKRFKRSQTKNTDFRCEQCQKNFSDKTSYLQHMRQKHRADAKISCPVNSCSERYQAFYMLVNHINKQHPKLKPTLPCEKCDDRFFVKAQLDKHVVRVHKEIKCEHCGKRMKSMRNLNRHIAAVHAIKIPLCCSKCNKICYTDETYKRHMSKHDNVDLRQICNYCGLKFIKLQQHVLNQHMNEHEKKFTCRFCSQQFDDMATLRRHSKTDHILERMNEVLDAECNLCGKKFLKRNLSNHMKRTHSDARPYKCDICGKTYKEKQHFNAHVILHTDTRPFACDLCDKKFRHAKTLRNHRQSAHESKMYSCRICFQQFRQCGDLKLHVQMHDATIMQKFIPMF